VDATPDGEYAIRLQGLGKRYPDGTSAVTDLSLDVRRGQVVCLVGPSGCGKSTTLRMVNRLVEPTSGRILLDGEDVTTMDAVALRRRMGYVIQASGLFPHRTVGQNVATVPRLVGWDKKRTAARVDELLDLVGLPAETYRDRYPSALSGGQQQRVGVARALAADPPVLLMDEPFGAVDPLVRKHLQQEFLTLQREVGKTVLFVTHDLEEAVALGDRIAVLSQGGHLEQFDTPAVIHERPATAFVAGFIGRERGIRHLAVTPLRDAQLASPATVRGSDRPGFAGSRLSTVGADWGIVLGEQGELLGWVGATDLRDHDGAEHVTELARPAPGVVQLDSPVLEALAWTLAIPEGWLAVCEGERYVGVFDRAGLPAVEPGPEEGDVGSSGAAPATGASALTLGEDGPEPGPATPDPTGADRSGPASGAGPVEAELTSEPAIDRGSDGAGVQTGDRSAADQAGVAEPAGRTGHR